jgi:hypothetical protein
MDEEEELENTLIGQQEALGATELIPGFGGVVADIDRRIGAPRQIGRAPGGLPIIGSPGGFRGDPGFAAIIGPDGQPRPAVNPSPMNSMMQQQSLSTSSQAPNPVNFLPYADDVAPSRVNDLSVFTPGGDLKPGIDVNAITPSPEMTPVEVAPKNALLEILERADEREARGLPKQAAPGIIDAPETPSINDIAPEITRGLPRGGDSRLTPRPELPSISPGFTPGPGPSLPDFIQDRTGREDRVGARTPEISSSVLPDILNPRSDRGREGLSQADARDLAQGLDPNASESQRMRALQIQSRLGLGQFKPERELSELEQREIESRIRGREADIAQGETKAGFEPRVIEVGGESAMELSPGYFQRIPKDTPSKTGLEKTLENLQADLESGRLTQEEYEIASKNARNVYIGRKEPKEPAPSPTPSSEFENIIKGAEAGGAPKVATGRGQARRGGPVEGADASDIKSFATEAEARASGEKGEVLIAGRRAVIE